MIRLGVNIDHVATLRNARGGQHPDPVAAALMAIEAGADGITAHLREDRRHIRDEDVFRLKDHISKPLNFEMAVTQEMVEIALRLQPHACCLVPERRLERTTEGGLDVIANRDVLSRVIPQLQEAGSRVSLFIAADEQQIEVASLLKVNIVELHTGAWCDHLRDEDYDRLVVGARLAAEAGLEVHAGHGLTFTTAEQLARCPEFVEFNIGHFLIGESLRLGLAGAVREMKSALARGRA